MEHLTPAPDLHRPDLKIIAGIVQENAKVLDIGCGDGTLLELLKSKGASCSGVELSQDGVNECVRKGLAVIQGDADRDLDSYISGVFDWVIMSHAILSVEDPVRALDRITAIGRGAIVSIHNFAHWKDRLNILVGGRIPAASPYLASWDTPGLVRRCSIKDFEDLCAARNLAIKHCIVLGENGHPLNPRLPPNLFGRQAVFVLEHK